MFWRLIAIFAVMFSFGSPGISQEIINVGVLAHRGEEAAVARWADTIRYLDEKLPEYRFMLNPLSLEGVEALLENDELDFLLTNPGHYHSVSDRFRLSQIASLKTDRRGKPVTGNRYGSVIFVRTARKDLQTIGDLKGMTFAGVSPDAFGGFLAAAQVFQRNGLNPYTGFKSIKFMGFPQDAIVDAVMRGEADAGTVRTGVLESMIASGRISAKDLKILNPQKIDGFELMLSTQLFPEWIFAASRATSGGLRKKVALALFAMDENYDAAISGRYGGWNTPMFDGTVRQLIGGKPASENHNLRDNIVVFLITVGTLVVLGFSIYRYVYLLPGRSPGRLPGNKSELPGKHRGDAQFLRLTPRENEVLAHVVSGKTNKEIARSLQISPKTVEFHRKHLMKKLGADSIADLVRIAVERENVAISTKT